MSKTRGELNTEQLGPCLQSKKKTKTTRVLFLVHCENEWRCFVPHLTSVFVHRFINSPAVLLKFLLTQIWKQWLWMGMRHKQIRHYIPVSGFGTQPFEVAYCKQIPTTTTIIKITTRVINVNECPRVWTDQSVRERECIFKELPENVSTTVTLLLQSKPQVPHVL